MKTTQQIAAECGLLERQTPQLIAILEGRWVTAVPGPYAADACEIIGALYRRIEKLEEEKSELVGVVANSMDEFHDEMLALGDKCRNDIHDAFAVCAAAISKYEEGCKKEVS